jgi:hypothetical protein
MGETNAYRNAVRKLKRIKTPLGGWYQNYSWRDIVRQDGLD